MSAPAPFSVSSITAHDNQTGLDLSRPPSTKRGDVKVHSVPLMRASAESLRGFGRPITDFATAGCDITPWPVSGWRPLCPGTGDEGGFVEDVFRLGRRGRVQFAENVGLRRTYVTGWYGDPAEASDAVEPTAEERASVLTHEANYHPDGAQVFASRDGAAFVLLLAKPGDDVRADSFVAFYVDPAHDGIIGVHVAAGVWHQPAFPAVGVEDAVMDNRQGKVHACVAVDFLREFGCYLRVPLRFVN
jgi:ureidoglycolate lyase